MHVQKRSYCCIFLLLLFWGGLQAQPRITESSYEEAGHFIVETTLATYYYDKAGGGLSRMIDREGKDWIAFKREPWNEYPASAASAYRGIPNFVFGSADGGAGHPGHDHCISEIVGENKIRTTSKSGTWQWEWTFFQDHARVQMLKIDPNHPYWFLYEGTPGGTFEPAKQFFGADTGGPRPEQWDYYNGEAIFERWQWVYFGHQESDWVLYIAQEEADELSDIFGYLGNTKRGTSSPDGMVVFGFGRGDGAKPLLTKANAFYLGFAKAKKKRKKASSGNTKARSRRFPEVPPLTQYSTEPSGT